MANKIYDLLPVHLRNKELETMFDSTLERAFSKGEVDKVRAFIGRKEKGIYSEEDAYVSFPEHLFQRDNYGLEPVFSNTNIGDNVFYDDLLNALYNKGALTNDHRRLFKSDTYTVNLPIDKDKFANWELYYWVKPGFTVDFALYSYYTDPIKNETYWRTELPYIITDEPGTGYLNDVVDGVVSPIETFGSIGDYAVVLANGEVVYWEKKYTGWHILGSATWRNQWPIATSDISTVDQNNININDPVKFSVKNKSIGRIASIENTIPARLKLHDDDGHIHDDHILLDGNKIQITLARGLEDLNDKEYYVKKVADDTYELYHDTRLFQPVDATTFNTYEDGGIVERIHDVEIPNSYHEIVSLSERINNWGRSIGIGAAVENNRLNLYNNGTIGDYIEVSGLSSIGIDDGSYKSRTFTQNENRPSNPLPGDTFVDTDELRVMIKVGNATYQLTDEIEDPYNIETNPYALKFPDADLGVLHLIEYKDNTEFTTPDWHQYTELENIFILGNSDDTHYITLEKDTDLATIKNWWSDRNSWYHYDDIRKYITSDNKKYIEQAKRPIIEYDNRIELSSTSAAATEFAVPTFKIYNSDNEYTGDYLLFHYVEDEDYALDSFLGIRAKLQPGDYISEFMFNIDIPDDCKYKIDNEYQDLYILSEFDYRNLRHEYGFGTHSQLELLQDPKTVYTIDVYVEGMKQIGNYTYSDRVITFDKPVEGYVYVDFCTRDNVMIDGDGSWQRIDPSLEYNPDNLNHNNVEMTYSTVYEHMLRIVETTIGLDGHPNGVNNYRKIGENADKLRFNKFGSVMVKNSIDIKKAYFSITRDDYDPFASLEYISIAYNNYKNKLVNTIQEMLLDPDAESKTDDIILEQAISEIALAKRESINVFANSKMINSGESPTHWIGDRVNPIVAGSKIQFIPDSVATEIVYDENVNVYINGILDKNYKILNGIEIEFDREITEDDVIDVRYYKLIKETFVPPSATKLGIAALYEPTYVTDTEFTDAITFLVGHDGSKMPIYGDRTDSIMFLFEKLVYNRIEKTESNSKLIKTKYGMYRSSAIEYSLNEKKYTMYPFFKKWILRNNIDNLYNTDYNPDDYKTWNYRGFNDATPGHWRGLYQYVYNTETPFVTPWETVGFSRPPEDFDMEPARWQTYLFWARLKSKYNAYWPMPVDQDDNVLTPEELFFGNQITLEDVALMDQDWEFGDGSPIEMAWRRSSEYPFIEFLTAMLMKPFEVIDNFSDELNEIISIYHKREGSNPSEILREQADYEFKLGSKLGGFVNNFKLSSENSLLSNSRYTEIPSDNYDLFVHTGEPNRSESFSAIVIEKVSIEDKWPTYSIDNLDEYLQGTIVYNSSDSRYYRRKLSAPTQKERAKSINFDYTAWTLISQPEIKKFGYRIHGYDEINPTFFAMDWDKTSGEKIWSTDGDEAVLRTWAAGEFYKNDTYVVYEGSPYVSLGEHTASGLFNDDLDTYWKLLKDWPRINQVEVKGYKKTLPDQIRNYNYGDVLYSRDDVAHLLIGYQDYLKAVGWDFTDINELGENVDFENLLIKFLDWSIEKHEPGEFISLTPILLSGRFTTPYGVAQVKKETNKNFYRVVDNSGRQIPNTAIKFYSDGDAITWESTIPVYGMKIDITDVEHAYVVDRVDSYGDVIYDPLHHNRNLRMIVDCNRTRDWDGTLGADGYILYDNQLIPNLETAVADTKYHRDTLVDQSLRNVNLLKANHIGYTPRSYLNNHLVERESQLEFYKGFLAGKGTDSSVNRILNKNSNFQDIVHKDMWAFKLGEYGNFNKDISSTVRLNSRWLFNDPYSVEYTNETPFKFRTNRRTTPIKTTGYVDSRHVNYIVRNATILETTVSDEYYEGDTAWIQFDSDREWDVRRLSEITEIVYVGETEDSQLYITVTNDLDITEPVYLKISNDEIDPELNGYFYLVDEGTDTFEDITVYKYLVFDTDYEPVTVEIDSTTQNSIYVPTSQNIGVEAIGSASNPILVDGETLVIDGESFVYVSGTGSTSSGIVIGGTTSTPDPIVSEGEQIRLVVYDDSGIIKNTNTIVTFRGTTLQGINALTSTQGDTVDINGTTLTIDYSATQNIEAISNITTSSFISTGLELTVTLDGSADTYTVEDIDITGTITNPTISETKSLRINNDVISFSVDPTTGTALEIDDIVQIINSSTVLVRASAVGGKLNLNSSEQIITLRGSVLIDLGIGNSSIYVESKLENLSVDINTKSGITSFTDSSNRLVIQASGQQMILSGSGFNAFGFPGSLYEATSDPTSTSVAQQINNLGIPRISATSVGGRLKVSANETDLTITEVTSGAMARLGFLNTTETANSLVNIIDDINSVLAGTDTNATSVDRRLLITGNDYTVSISDLTGNPLSDLGIVAGDYINTQTVSTSLVEFRDQINEQSSVITASITSDGRFIITSPNLTLTFSGTSNLLLDKFGFYKDYTSITSNANFKVMRWKSVRFTPGYNGEDFDDFYVNLGLNAESKIWADDYLDAGWAVLERSIIGNLTIINRKAKEVDVDLVNRLIIKDGDEYINHQLFDPLNLKLPGSIMKEIDYIDWHDPAKYDEYFSDGLWLNDKLGEIWWDTTAARFYRYNDYGDANGNISIDYVKRHWGKVVDGSVIEIKQWVENEVLPTGITWFNQKTYWDDVRNKEVTKYYYWTSLGSLPRYNKEYSTDEIKMIIETGDIKNKFLPINANTVVIANRDQFNNKWIEITTEYSSDENKQQRHSDWQLLSHESDIPVMSEYLVDFKNSIANSKIENYSQTKTILSDLDQEGAKYYFDFLLDLTKDDIAVSVNNEFLELDDFSINGTELRINNNFDVIQSDVVRVYHLSDLETNWFSNLGTARDNFKSIINDHFNSRLIEAVYPFYKDYVKLDHYIFQATDWFIDDDYKEIDYYEYLGRSRNIDMKTMFETGTRSFRIKNENYDEYYFGYGDPKEITMVNKVGGALGISFTDIVLPGQTGDGGVSKYYENIINVQIHELVNLIYSYSENWFIKDVFFSMLEYIYTEKTYPDWLFKTSYIDVDLLNRPLRQYAVYQRDTYDDTIEYLLEAKPYHVKLRDIRRIYPIEEVVDANIDALHHLNLRIDFGNHSRYMLNVLDGGIEPQPTWPELEDGTYEQGAILRRFYETTAESGGYDTGLVESRLLDAVVIKIDNFTNINRNTLEKKSFIVYDNLGRGHMMHVTDTDTVSDFTKNLLTVTDPTKFRNAKAEALQIIAVEDANGDIEFMHYNRKNGDSLTLKDRALFNGVGVNAVQGDKIYIMSSPETMVFLIDQPDKQLL